MQQPPLGWTTNVTVDKVSDGDTVEVTFSRKIQVRITDDLEDYNTPEITKAKTKEEKKRGLEAKQKLTEILSNAKEVVLYVPTDQKHRVQDIFTLGRVVGRIFVDGQDVTELMKEFNVGLKKK